MSTITAEHFQVNVILTRDSFRDGEPFGETLKEIQFTSFRYPGGGVTEDQTWENHGLDRMFGQPMEPGSDNYVLTIREALSYASEHGHSLSLVTPTFQFFDKNTGSFDHFGFDRYIDALETSILEHPDVIITDFEIGNEYWGSKNWGSLTATQYGQIADAEIPKLSAMIDRISVHEPAWQKPGIGVQAGVQWRAEENADGTWTAVGPRESEEIIAEISMDNRAEITTVFQHSYPDANTVAKSINWALRPMEVFQKSEGFRDDLKLTLSEFNIGANTATGIDQGAAWIEALSLAVEGGIDAIDHWGISYDWLSNKFYDTKFPPAESVHGTIVAIATPMGQIYDLAQSNLVGKSTMDPEASAELIKVSEDTKLIGFSDYTQKVIFLHNKGGEASNIDLSTIDENAHLAVHHLVPADSPHTPWYDETVPTPPGPQEIVDARADMKVVAGGSVPKKHVLQPGEMLVVIISDPDRDLIIEGAHQETDPSTGMVNDFIVGSDGNDIIRGHVGDDTIDGGAGCNVLSGGRGDNLIASGDEGDVIFSSGGADTMVGGNGRDLIFSGSEEYSQSSFIEGGSGSDLFLIGGGKDTTLHDFGEDDLIGLQGAFEDIQAFRDAMTVEGEDIYLDLPDGSRVKFEHAADRTEALEDQIIDFMEPERILEITDSYLADLTQDQVAEVFNQKEQMFPEPDEDGPRYFDSLEETLSRLDSDQDDMPDIPMTPPEDPPPPEEDEDEPALSSSAACFVATAAFGNRNHPDVVALREFRDKHLIRFKAGRSFVRAYWIVGPRLAKVTSPGTPHGWVARHLLSGFASGLRRANLVNS